MPAIHPSIHAPLRDTDESTNKFSDPGILHYQWSRNPSLLNDPLNKAMAGIVNVLLWSSSAWYTKNGVTDNAVAVALAAALHGFAVLKNIL